MSRQELPVNNFCHAKSRAIQTPAVAGFDKLGVLAEETRCGIFSILLVSKSGFNKTRSRKSVKTFQRTPRLSVNKMDAVQ